MSIHTICARGYRRIVVRPSKVSVGAVQIEILGADRQVLALVNLGAEDVGVLTSALHVVAAEAASDSAVKYAAKYLAKYPEVV